MLDAEEELRERRAADKEEFRSRGETAYQEEVAAAHERSVEREEWRREQHARKEAEKKEQARQEEKKKKEKMSQEKKEAVEAEQKEDMRKLHDIAIRKRLEERKESIEKGEEEAKKKANDQMQRDDRATDQELDRALTAIERDMRKKGDQFAAGIERRRKMLEDSFTHAKQMLQQEEKSYPPSSKAALDVGHELMQLKSEHKRQLMSLDKEVDAMAVKLKQEQASLEQEAHRKASEKSMRLHLEHDRRVREAGQKRASALEWIGLNDPDGEKK